MAWQLSVNFEASDWPVCAQYRSLDRDELTMHLQHNPDGRKVDASALAQS